MCIIKRCCVRMIIGFSMNGSYCYREAQKGVSRLRLLLKGTAMLKWNVRSLCGRVSLFAVEDQLRLRNCMYFNEWMPVVDQALERSKICSILSAHTHLHVEFVGSYILYYNRILKRLCVIFNSTDAIQSRVYGQ